MYARSRSDRPVTWPTTAFKAGEKTVVVTTQFDRRGDNAAKTPFTVAQVPVSLIE